MNTARKTRVAFVSFSLLASFQTAWADGTPVSPPLAPVAATAPAVQGTSITDYTRYNWGDYASVKLNVLLQGWALGNQNTAATNQNFRLRRSEFKVSGLLFQAPKYFFMIDPSKAIPLQGGKPIATDIVLQEFGMSYAFMPGLELTAGQFKIPTTAEGLDPSAELPLPERSLVGRTYGDKREMGVKVGYKNALINTNVMLTTGYGSWYTQANGSFNDLDARFEATPLKGVSVGTFGVIGNGFNYNQKGRWGLNARYEPGNLRLRTEYVQAMDTFNHAQGMTAEAGYWLTESLEPVLRFETFNPNQALSVLGQAETVGMNYLFKQYLTKVQVSASALQNMVAPSGSPVVSAPGTSNFEFTAALQAAI